MRAAPVLFVLAVAATAAAQPPPAPVVVKVNKLAAPAPAGWASEKPANRLRSYQFQLPGDKGGPAGELTVSPEGNPKADVVFPRWKGEFSTEEASRVSKLAVTGATVDLLDVTGTWKYRPRPLDPKVEERPEYRVVWAVVADADEATHVRLSGPKEVVAKHYPAFEAWLKALK